MKSILRFFFSVKSENGQIDITGPILFYLLVGLAAFGHNYVNYPIMDGHTQQVWIQVVDEKGEEVPGKSAWSEQQFPAEDVFRSASGAKAFAAGLLWPGYISILINEELK